MRVDDVAGIFACPYRKEGTDAAFHGESCTVSSGGGGGAGVSGGACQTLLATS